MSATNPSLTPQSLSVNDTCLLESRAVMVTGRATSDSSDDPRESPLAGIDLRAGALEVGVGVPLIPIREIRSISSVGGKPAKNALEAAESLLRLGPVTTTELTRWFAYGFVMTNDMWDDSIYDTWVGRVQDSVRAEKIIDVVEISLLGVAARQILEGNIDQAEKQIKELLNVVAERGGRTSWYEPLNANVLAWRGDGPGARSAITALLVRGQALGLPTIVDQANFCLAVLELGNRNYAAALDAAGSLANSEAPGWTSLGLPLLVEAGARTGDIGRATAACMALESRARSCNSPWALGLLARSKAILANAQEAETYFLESVYFLEKTSKSIDLAHTHLVLGEWLRRQRRRSDARHHLRIALEMFGRMGIHGFSERARLELVATGERLGKRGKMTPFALTPQELQIAQLASRGATNLEIAGKLYLCTSTVDYHLRKVYRKLGIGSRRQLGVALPA